MMRLALLVACLTGAMSMPGDDEIASEIEAFLNGSSKACTEPECKKPNKKFEQIQNTMPGYQWGDAGGYCGSFATQRAAMAKGAWISQQQVRDHTTKGAPGGHDREILDTNIAKAWTNLKFKFEAFDTKHEATPQLDGIRKFMRKQIGAGHVVVMMIQKAGHRFPIYDMPPPSGFYDHVVPFVGLLSDHALTDENFYDDDYIVHYTDHSVYPYYRSMKSLVGAYNGQSSCPSTSGDPQYVCLNPTYGYGWALQGFEDEKDGLPASLTVDPSDSEPDTRSGRSPTQLTGTLHIKELKAGQKYTIYRWDSVEAAFDYTKPTSTHQFTASGATETYKDPKTFISSGVTYYRCILDSNVLV
jgi:hypothetical protein